MHSYRPEKQYEPEPLNPARLFAGRYRLHFPKIDSTNSFLLRNEKLLATGGLVVTADSQTSGRGRKGRSWSDLGGGQLLASVVLHPQLPNFYLPSITIFVGLAVLKALHHFNCHPLGIKWPNDILLNNKKVCGILCELRSLPLGPVVVAGIGLNVNGSPEQFPSSLRNKASTLEAEMGRSFNKEDILEAILAQLDAIMIKAQKGEIANLFKEWETHSDSINKEVYFYNKNTRLKGVIKGLDKKGRLLVQVVGDNKDILLSAEEVEFV